MSCLCYSNKRSKPTLLTARPSSYRQDIHAGMKLGCNQPAGPLALADMIGLDVCVAVINVYLEELGDSKYRPARCSRN